MKKVGMQKNKVQKKQKITGRFLLPVVILIYLLLYVYEPIKTTDALTKSLTTLMHLLPVFVVVILIMGLITALIQTKNLTKFLGRQSGIKAWVIAVLGGILSHGSSYIWYQMLANLRVNHVRDSLIMTFLYARAIKLPWLPLMISYFGFTFTLLLTAYIILGAVIQGLIVEKMIPYKA